MCILYIIYIYIWVYLYNYINIYIYIIYVLLQAAANATGDWGLLGFVTWDGCWKKTECKPMGPWGSQDLGSCIKSPLTCWIILGYPKMIQNGRVETVENQEWLALQLWRGTTGPKSPRVRRRGPSLRGPPQTDSWQMRTARSAAYFFVRNWDNHFGKNLQPRRIPKLDPSQIVTVWNPNLVRLISVWKRWNPNSWKSSGLLAVSWDWSVWKCSLKLHTVAKKDNCSQKVVKLPVWVGVFDVNFLNPKHP